MDQDNEFGSLPGGNQNPLVYDVTPDGTIWVSDIGKDSVLNFYPATGPSFPDSGSATTTDPVGEYKSVEVKTPALFLRPASSD